MGDSLEFENFLLIVYSLSRAFLGDSTHPCKDIRLDILNYPLYQNYLASHQEGSPLRKE